MKRQIGIIINATTPIVLGIICIRPGPQSKTSNRHWEESIRIILKIQTDYNTNTLEVFFMQF